MPKYYCDYCDTFLTHDSPSVRKTHCTGRKHKDNVKFYYQKWMEEQAQHLIDATTGMLSIISFLNHERTPEPG
jgi:U1 small nuclear ribonucleoprotein C